MWYINLAFVHHAVEAGVAYSFMINKSEIPNATFSPLEVEEEAPITLNSCILNRRSNFVAIGEIGSK